MKEKNFDVTFWGVRGSRPVPGENTLRYGGNTPCIEIDINNQLLIFDAGTGICNLGNKLISKNGPINGHLFISHTHWDHIQGFPFFTPAFVKGNRFKLYGQGKMNLTFARLMQGQMEHPHFPVLIDQMGAIIELYEIDTNQTIRINEDINVKTTHTNHPNGCLAYRIEANGKSCCYVTDTEHYSIIDPNLLTFVQNTDLLIYDTNFTDDEYSGKVGYPSKTGWGHSTWQEGIKLADAASVKQLCLFHHATHRTDSELDIIAAETAEKFPNSFAAKEGLTVNL